MPKQQKMTGRVLQAAIMEEMQLRHWRCVHFQSVLTTGRNGKPHWRTPFQGSKGFPDIFAVRAFRALAVEVKGHGDSLKPEQEQWLAALAEAGIETHVWTPASLRSGVVENVLR